jgi:TRAP-type mannitol/chloroaromatic compound transport system permease large subunit
MDPSIVAVGGFAGLFTLMLLRFPIGLAMGAVGVAGFALMVGLDPALKLLAQSPIRTATDAGFAVIPLFLLMGTIASVSGMSAELFQAANSFLGHRKGGLGMATIAA